MLIKGILRQSEQSNFGSAQDVDFELCGNMGISQQLDSKEWYAQCLTLLNKWVKNDFYQCWFMAIRVMEFSNGGYKIRKKLPKNQNMEIIEFLELVMS